MLVYCRAKPKRCNLNFLYDFLQVPGTTGSANAAKCKQKLYQQHFKAEWAMQYPWAQSSNLGNLILH
jgi:hypothetical protein